MLITIEGALTLAARVIAAEIDAAIRAFVSLPAKVIQDACNKRRLWLAGHMRSSPTFLADHGLGDVSLDRAQEELAPEFVLVLPTKVTVQLIDGPVQGSDAPMGAAPDLSWMFAREDQIDASHLVCKNLCFDEFDHGRLERRLVEFSVRRMTFHEMLHLSGDWLHDGIIRHNWVGIIAVERALQGEDAAG